MATRFEARAGLDEVVAGMVAARAEQLGEDVASTARRLAPGLKRWVTRGDGTVRPEHQAANGQTVPANLRFVLASPAYDREHYHVGTRQLLREPRDRDGSPGLVIGCRCQMAVDDDGLARQIRTTRAVREGARVVVYVYSRGPRVVEAEYGTEGDRPARYMGRAVQAVADAHRG